MYYKLISPWVAVSAVSLFMSTCVNAASDESAEIAADPTQTSPLEEIIVTASRVATPIRQVGTAVTIVNDTEIELRGYNSLADVLRTEVGVGVSNNGGAGKVTTLRIRGEEGYRTLVIIDGMEVSDASGTQVGPHMGYASSTADIERVEILHGPQGFAYGADAGGVVNIFTRKPAQGVAAEVGLEGGQFNTLNTHGFIAAANSTVDGFLSLSNQRTSGFNAAKSDPNEDDDGNRNTTVHARAGFNVNDRLRLEQVVRSVDADTEYDNCFNIDHDCATEFSQVSGRFSVKYDGDRLDHSAGFSLTEVEREYYSSGESTYEVEGSIEKFDYVGSAMLNDQIQLVVGSDYKIESTVSNNEETERSQLGIFSELQANWNDNVYLAAGTRFDDNEDFGQHTSIRISGAIVQEFDTSSLKYRSSAGTGFRAPSIGEVGLNRSRDERIGVQSTALYEERSQGWDFGVDLYTDGGNGIQATLFYQVVSDQLYFYYDPDTGGHYRQDSGDSKSKGIELTGDYHIYPWLNLRSNYTYNIARDTDDKPRLRRPKHMANMGLEFSLLDSKLTLLSNLRLVQSTKDVGDVDLDNYGVVDLSGTYKTERLTYFARIENVLDRDYVEVSDYNVSGRAAYAGVKYRF